ncbi:MAG: hypothetical protein KF914_14285 [Rhizobiaceae bacterium]|nr:hypothetical protein [Rhizobiaceae bacterium]
MNAALSRSTIRRQYGRLRSLAAGLLAALALPASPGVSAELPLYGVFWQSAPSHWVEMGKRLYGEETGQTVGDADVLVAWVDANQDTIADLLVYPINPKLCGEPACEPRLYSFVDDRYRERIAGLGDSTKVMPAYIEMLPWYRGIHKSLKFDASILHWNGKDRYERESLITEFTLDASAFLQACSTSPSLLADTSNPNTADPAGGVAELCSCIAYQFGARRIDQADMDRLAARDDEKGLRLQQLDAESESACRILYRWQPWPQPDAFPPRGNDVRGFYEACSRQDWVIDSARIGSPHRAMALCGCVAEGLTRQGTPQSSLDLLAELYRDETSEEDVLARDADIIDASDQLTESCVSSLRHADYVNGVDRPGSPKPFKPKPGEE